MSLVLDAGALIAIERRDLSFGAVLLVAQRRGVDVITSSAVVAQVWRGGSDSQANLARQLAGIGQRDLTAADARRVGQLLKESGTSDVVDGHVAVIIRTGDTVVTSDVDDIALLLERQHVKAKVMRV